MAKSLTERLADIPVAISANVSKALIADITDTVTEATNAVRLTKLQETQINNYKEKEASYQQQATAMAAFKTELDRREAILQGAEDFKQRTSEQMASLKAEVDALRWSMSVVFGREE